MTKMSRGTIARMKEKRKRREEEEEEATCFSPGSTSRANASGVISHIHCSGVTSGHATSSGWADDWCPLLWRD
jgi:hypothetical protein